jgi:hypothetical protein
MPSILDLPKDEIEKIARELVMSVEELTQIVNRPWPEKGVPISENLQKKMNSGRQLQIKESQ